jgi:UDP-N-acetylmuramate--alanine ligase
VIWSSGAARLIDDYGHHPTELAVTLKAVREAFLGRRLVMVYQPHRYTRTRDHFDEFVSVLSEGQQLVLLDVYSAGEPLIKGADSLSLANAIRTGGAIDPILVSDQTQLAKTLIEVLQDQDVLLMQGAGDIGRLAATLAQAKRLEVLS